MIDELYQMLGYSGGFVRTNRFRVTMTLPEQIRGNYQEDLEKIGLMCREFPIPGWSIGTDNNRTGPERSPEFVSNFEFQDIDLVFYVDSRFRIRTMFEDWRDLAVDKYTRQINFYENYVADMMMTPLKKEVQDSGESIEIISCLIVDAYPKVIGSIGFSYENDNAIAILPVTFAYYDMDLDRGE